MAFVCRPINTAINKHCARKAAIQMAGRKMQFAWSSINAPEGIKNAEKAARSGFEKIPSGAIKIMMHT